MRRGVLLVLAVAVVALVVARTCGDSSAPPDDAVPAAAPPDRVARATPSRPRARAAAPAEEEPVAGEEREPAAALPASVTTPAESQGPAETDPLPEGEIPEADRGTGDASVRIRLVDAVTGKPVESQIRLWRLGVPADPKWPAGDHVQASADRPMSDETFGSLPPGRYRVEVLAADPASEDPPAFDVDASGTEVVLPVRMPPVHRVRVRIFTETGELIVAARAWGPGPGETGGVPMRGPAWARPRNPHPDGTPQGRRGGRRTLRGARTPIAAVDGAFDLGTIRGRGRHDGWTAWTTIAIEGRSDVDVSARSDGAERGDYVAVSVPIAGIADHVRLPDGRTATDAGARIKASAFAVPLPEGVSAADAARTVAVRVSVALDGWVPIDFERRVGDPAPAPVTLTPIAKDAPATK